jgi:threonine/homoserine/homoserine lactone efflux protein
VSGGLPLLAAAAGALYIVTPGPAFVALLGLCAARGRRAGFGFVLGHMAGDLLWTSLALLALVGAQAIHPAIFDLLGLACGLYLLVLGWQALKARSAAEAGLALFDRPLRRGLIFGLTNPKGYPVAVGMFAALLGPHADALDLAGAPLLVAASMAGGAAAALLLVWFAGLATVRDFYRRRERLVTRCAGLLFVGFGLSALAAALPGFAGRHPWSAS